MSEQLIAKNIREKGIEFPVLAKAFKYNAQNPEEKPIIDSSQIRNIDVDKIRNVILDLDNTLICSEPIKEFPFSTNGIQKKSMKFPVHNIDYYYICFERPHLQEFLDYLFKNFTVSVWTAASVDYALFIVKNIILKKSASATPRNLKYMFVDYHCDISRRLYKNKKGTSLPKKLDLLWENFNLLDFTKSNTIIIDDNDRVVDSQPENVIHIEPFEIITLGKDNIRDIQSSTINDNILIEMPHRINSKFKMLTSTPPSNSTLNPISPSNTTSNDNEDTIDDDPISFETLY